MQIRLSASASIPARYLNRHALITGQTGTGKTVSVLRLSESMAKAGIPVFLADVKGDMSPLARSCDARRLDMLGGAAQVPVWALGADLLARALELTEAQSATLEIAFTWAERNAAPLDTLDDLRGVLATILGNRAAIAGTLGQVSPASVGVVMRGLLRLENMGAARLFGGNRLDIAELIQPGRVTILDATRLFQTPRLYGAFLLWLMREFWQRIPERGDSPAPAIALVFDEAHTIFGDATPALIRATEQTARLIRSKGVSLIWASQSPSDIPAIIADQAATRITHNRSRGIGRAEFVTLDSTGRPTSPREIRPELPSCGLALETVPDMRPPVPPAPIASPAIDWRGYLVAAMFAAIPLAAIAVLLI